MPFLPLTTCIYLLISTVILEFPLLSGTGISFAEQRENDRSVMDPGSKITGFRNMHFQTHKAKENKHVQESIGFTGRDGTRAVDGQCRACGGCSGAADEPQGQGDDRSGQGGGKDGFRRGGKEGHRFEGKGRLPGCPRSGRIRRRPSSGRDEHLPGHAWR